MLCAQHMTGFLTNHLRLHDETRDFGEVPMKEGEATREAGQDAATELPLEGLQKTLHHIECKFDYRGGAPGA